MLLWFPLGMSILVLVVCVTVLLYVRRRTLRQAGRETAVQMPELWALGKSLVLVVGGVGGLIGFIELAHDEGLFLAEPVVQLLRVAFVAGFAWAISRVGGSIGRDLQAAGLMETKRPDPLFFKMMIAMVIVLSLYSHGFIWGVLHRMDRGRPVAVTATVVKTGHRGRQGSWIDVRVEGETRVREMMPRGIYPVRGEDYSCTLETVKAGDTLRLTGKASFLGLAVAKMEPGNERLVGACKGGA